MKEMQFKVGDLVWCTQSGFGTVEEENDGFDLSVGNLLYHSDGRCRASDKYRSLLTVEEAELLGHKMPQKKQKRYGFTAITADNPAFISDSFDTEKARDWVVNSFGRRAGNLVVSTFEYEV